MTIHASVLPYRVRSVRRAKASSGMDVDREPLAGVEQLDEERRVGAAAGRVVRAEERDRVGGRGVAQRGSRRAGG